LILRRSFGILVSMSNAALVLVTLLLACPLFAWPGTGFDAVRLPAVLALVAGLLAVAFARSARGGERPPGPRPLRTAGLILLAVHLISLGLTRTLAEAATPVLILFAGVSAFSCLRAGLIRKEAAMGLAPVISGVALAVSAIAIGSKLFALEPVALEGNRNYAGALGAMLLPATVAFTRAGRTPRRLLAGLASLGLITLLVLSESRGGFLAAAAGLIVVGAALGLKRVDRGIAVTAGALLLLGAAVGILQGRRQLSAERLQTAGFRLDVWKSGLRMVLARPLLGWGAGGFAVEYPPFRSESEFRYSQQQPPPGFRELEDAHSSWVQTAVETGTIGLLAFLLLGYVAARLWRYYVRTASDPETVALLAGLGGGAAAYLVAGFFNSLTLKMSHTLLFWMFLGLIEAIGDARPWRSSGRAREGSVAVPAAVGVLALFGALWAGAMGMADADYVRGMTTKTAEGMEARLRGAIETDPYFWKARYELCRLLTAVGRYQGAVEEGRAALRLRPFHVEALNATAISAFQASGDDREAEALLRRGIEVAPFYYKSFYNLGLLERKRDRRPEARELLTRSIELNPSDGASYYHRGAVLFASGEASPAAEDFRKALLFRFPVAQALRAELPAAANDSRFAEFFR
jgi:O-antigen ligase/Flp pilus assembly protein TadD